MKAEKALFSQGRGRFEELTRDECVRLLEAKSVGRIAFCGPDGPRVYPVNYTWRDGAVIFRTAAYNSLATGVRDAAAAFEVDDFDEFLQGGWSVLAVGRARAVEDPDEVTDMWGGDRAPEPWAAGTRALFIRLVPRQISGRRVHPS
jgi:nitroimidazol reductase NimA-like FMN-containing flavoprotein (pyridoxamine 5'-phosphate oxidase superfamily)